MKFHRGFLPALLASFCAVSLAGAADEVPGVAAAKPASKSPAAAKQLSLMQVVKTFEPPKVGDLRAERDHLAVAISPNDKMVVISNHGHLVARDIESERELWTRDLSAHEPTVMRFAPDGKGLLVAHSLGGKETSEILTLEPETGETIRHADGPMYGTGLVVASPDGKMLLAWGGSSLTKESWPWTGNAAPRSGSTTIPCSTDSATPSLSPAGKYWPGEKM
jgi:hypothetical protein